MSTAQDLPVAYADPAAAPALRLVPAEALDFDAAVRRIRPRLHRYAVRRLGDVHEAEELVQEALLRAYSHRAQLLTEDDLAAWTTVVTGRLVIDRLRVRGRSTPVSDVPETARLGRDTADVVVARDEARLALDALDAMPPRQAAVLWAREVEGSSYDDLCARFGMTEPAVRSVLTRARKALRKEYASRGGTLPVGGLAVLAPWVAGLGWAERLRRAATRGSTPAALSALAVSALGGLVLSPFGLAPHHPPATYTPSRAVVTTPASDGVTHGAGSARLTASTAASRPTGSPPVSGGAGSLRPLVDRVNNTCVNDTSASRQGNSVAYGGTTVGGVSTGGAGCNRSVTTPSSRLYLDVPLPANPAGVDYLGVTSNDLSCSAVPSTPLVKCLPPPTPSKSGAQP